MALYDNNTWMPDANMFGGTDPFAQYRQQQTQQMDAFTPGMTGLAYGLDTPAKYITGINTTQNRAYGDVSQDLLARWSGAPEMYRNAPLAEGGGPAWGVVNGQWAPMSDNYDQTLSSRHFTSGGNKYISAPILAPYQNRANSGGAEGGEIYRPDTPLGYMAYRDLGEATDMQYDKMPYDIYDTSGKYMGTNKFDINTKGMDAARLIAQIVATAAMGGSAMAGAGAGGGAGGAGAGVTTAAEVAAMDSALASSLAPYAAGAAGGLGATVPTAAEAAAGSSALESSLAPYAAQYGVPTAAQTAAMDNSLQTSLAPYAQGATATTVPTAAQTSAMDAQLQQQLSPYLKAGGSGISSTLKNIQSNPIVKAATSGLGGGSGGNGLGGLAQLIGAGQDIKMADKSADSILAWLQSQMDYMDKLYAPGTPEYDALWQAMSRKDAAAGRNSQYGPRSVDLAAKLADIKGTNRRELAKGFSDIYANTINKENASGAALAATLGSLLGNNSGNAGNSLSAIIDQIGGLFGGSGSQTSGTDWDKFFEGVDFGQYF